MNIRHGYLIALLLLLLSAPAYSQMSGRDAGVIRYAKNLSVSVIERGMPKQRLDRWLRKTLGKKLPLKWEVNDCGEQTGTPADRGRDFSMCVEASAETVDLYVGVSLQVGTFKKGIRSNYVQIRGISIHVEGEGKFEVTKLSELPTRLKEAGVSTK